MELKKTDVRQNLADCWNTVRNKVEFAENGKDKDMALVMVMMIMFVEQEMLGVVTPSALS